MLPQRMKKAVTDNPKKLANLIDLVNLPPTLRDFVGQSQTSRLTCFMRVWSYVKTNNLQILGFLNLGWVAGLLPFHLDLLGLVQHFLLLFLDIDKKDVSLSKFKGKVLLIVNVASRCGLTSSNYTELSHLYENFKDRGLEVLAFPCNQFGMQEPGSNEEIKQFACTKFKAEFPIFDKVDVNGPFTAPVYQFLKSSSGGFFGDLVKWNLN
ncbi:unnamed protein product [Vicia faba]|uniref:Glutathione peroxidase n=1 Tax=Vicia faba TaxID=3906 RepID=A0AAV0ZHN0_VICFA|nr:unnamed protein product [Vicia faba]